MAHYRTEKEIENEIEQLADKIRSGQPTLLYYDRSLAQHGYYPTRSMQGTNVWAYILYIDTKSIHVLHGKNQEGETTYFDLHVHGDELFRQGNGIGFALTFHTSPAYALEGAKFPRLGPARLEDVLSAVTENAFRAKSSGQMLFCAEAIVLLREALSRDGDCLSAETT